MMKTLACFVLLGLAAANTYLEDYRYVAPEDYEVAKDEEMKELAGDTMRFLRANKQQTRTRARAHSPNGMAAIPDAEAATEAKPGNFFAELDNGVEYPLSFKQVCVQFDVPLPVPGLTVNIGLGVIMTSGSKCSDGKSDKCFMKVEADLGLGLSATIGIVTGTVYVNGHLEVSSADTPTCQSQDKGKKLLLLEEGENAPKGAAKPSGAGSGAGAGSGDDFDKDAATKDIEGIGSKTDTRCGHSLLIRRWLRHYVGKYFMKSEKAKQALFGQLLQDTEDTAAEKEMQQEQGFINRMLADLSSANKAGAASVPFHPTDNPVYRMGQVLNTQYHDLFLPHFLDKQMWTHVKLQPFMLNRDKLKKEMKKGTLPKDLSKPTYYPFMGKPYENACGTPCVVGGADVKNFKTELQKPEVKQSKARIQELFMWAVRHMSETMVMKMFFFGMKVTDHDRLDYQLGEWPPAPRLDSCSSFKAANFDTFDNDKAVPEAKPARKVGEKYGAFIKGGNGYQYRNSPRMLCTMGKSISKLPDNAAGLTDDAEMLYNWGGRKQLQQKPCKLDQEKCKITVTQKDGTTKKLDRLDLGCSECAMEPPKEKKDNKLSWNKISKLEKCKRVPMERVVDMKPGIKPLECSNNYLALWPEKYAVPLWTANVFPGLLKFLQDYGEKMAKCSTGVQYNAPKTLKGGDGANPVQVGPKKVKECCTNDITCSTGFCDRKTFGCNECRSLDEASPSKKLNDPIRKGATPGMMKFVGEDCFRDWQCQTGKCEGAGHFQGTCAENKAGGPNTCVSIMEEFMQKAHGLAPQMDEGWLAAFGIMDSKAAKNVCKGYKPAPFGGKATGKCDAAEAMSVIVGANPDKKKKSGMAFMLLSHYAKSLDKYLEESEKRMDATMAKMSTQDKFVVSWEANLAVGTTFGFGSSAGSVGFCTPDTNNIQTLTPVVAYASSFGGASAAEMRANKGETTVGFSILGHPHVNFGLGLTATYSTGSGAWDIEVEFRIYVGRSSIGNGGAGGSMTAEMGDGVLTGMGPIVGCVVTAATEIFLAGGGAIEAAKKKFKEFVATIKKPGAGKYAAIGKFLLGAALAAGASYLAAMALAAAAKAVGIAATNYYILVVKRTSDVKSMGEGQWTAEFGMLRTIELTIGIPGVATAKPMVGWGTNHDFGAKFNKMFNIKIKDKKTGKEVSFKPDENFSDTRSLACKQCNVLVSLMRPKGDKEKKANKVACTTGDGKNKKFGCNDPKTTTDKSLYPEAGNKIGDFCTKEDKQPENDGKKGSLATCKKLELELRTAFDANTESSTMYAMFGYGEGDEQNRFVEIEDKRQIYAQAAASCKTSKNPHCYNINICKLSGVACFDEFA